MGSYLHCAIFSIGNDIGSLFFVLKYQKHIILSFASPNFTIIDLIGVSRQDFMVNFAEKLPRKVEKKQKHG